MRQATSSLPLQNLVNRRHRAALECAAEVREPRIQQFSTVPPVRSVSTVLISAKNEQKKRGPRPSASQSLPMPACVRQ